MLCCSGFGGTSKTGPRSLDEQVRKLKSTSVSVPLPQPGRDKPILRLNALPVLSRPAQCLELSFSGPKNWDDIRQARINSHGSLILTKAETVLCWGDRALVKATFGNDLLSINDRDLPADLCSPHSLYVKGFVEEALCKALARGKSLLPRISRTSAFLIADPRVDMAPGLQPLREIIGSTSGMIAGLFAPVTEDHPQPEKVTWAEAVRVSIDFKNGQLWLLLDPDIWIGPRRARKDAADFLDQRRGDRYNKTYNALLDAWIQIVLGTPERNIEVTLSAFDAGTGSENPFFKVASRTAFARRLAA